ncbi:MAG: hypothetical protein WCP39_01260 [Chlamydiota bacterium]
MSTSTGEICRPIPFRAHPYLGITIDTIDRPSSSSSSSSEPASNSPFRRSIPLRIHTAKSHLGKCPALLPSFSILVGSPNLALFQPIYTKLKHLLESPCVLYNESQEVQNIAQSIQELAQKRISEYTITFVKDEENLMKFLQKNSPFESVGMVVDPKTKIFPTFILPTSSRPLHIAIIDDNLEQHPSQESPLIKRCQLVALNTLILPYSPIFTKNPEPATKIKIQKLMETGINSRFILGPLSSTKDNDFLLSLSQAILEPLSKQFSTRLPQQPFFTSFREKRMTHSPLAFSETLPNTTTQNPTNEKEET